MLAPEAALNVESPRALGLFVATGLALLVAACVAEPPVDPSCTDPITWWPDADGDGVGEPTSTYVGCVPPAGWVEVLDTGLLGLPTPWFDTGPVDSGYDSGWDSGYDSGYDSGSTGHTGLQPTGTP